MTQQSSNVPLSTTPPVTPSSVMTASAAPSGGNGVSASTTSVVASKKPAAKKPAAKKPAAKKAAPKKAAPKKPAVGYVSYLVPVADIVVREGVNPRQTFDKEALAELTASVKVQGILEPLLVVPSEDTPGKFELVCGERRLRAAKTLRMKEVPAVVRGDMSREEQYIARVQENIQRADLNCIEEAHVFQNYMEATGKNAKETSDTFCKKQAYISQRLKLLTLPKEIQLSLARDEINFTQARELGRLDSTDQSRTFSKVRSGDIDKAEQITRTVENKRAEKRAAAAEEDAKADGKRRGRPPRTKDHAPDIVRQPLINAVERLNAYAIEARPKTQTRDALVALYGRFTSCRSDTKKEQLRGKIHAMEWVLGIHDEF